QERYRDAFYAPLMSDWRNFESWEEAGAVWTHQRANTAWKQILAEYEKPEIDPAIDEELCAFIERRKTEGGAPTDF
ncbi:MAG: trimethylamine methyltransferase family protein, partial [Candidatus Puniceispirillaceae bacterium]